MRNSLIVRGTQTLVVGTTLLAAPAIHANEFQLGPPTIVGDGPSVYDALAVDVDGDSDLDVVVASPEAKLYIQLTGEQFGLFLSRLDGLNLNLLLFCTHIAQPEICIVNVVEPEVKQLDHELIIHGKVDKHDRYGLPTLELCLGATFLL